jgi:hypothetical protein
MSKQSTPSQVGGLIACLLLVAACQSGRESGPQTTRSFRNVVWPSVIDDLDCEPMNRGVELGGVTYGNARGNGVTDAVVWVDCFHDASTWPYQVEVFDGASDPARPGRLAVLISTQEQLIVKSVEVIPGTTVAVSR